MQGANSRTFVRFCNNNSLSHNLLLGIISIVCAMIMMLGIYHYSQTYCTTLDRVEKGTSKRIQHLAEVLSIPIWNIEHDTVDRIISIASEIKTVTRIQVEEPDGKLIADKISDLTVPAEKVISRDIYYNDQHIGRVTVHLSFAALKKEQQQELIRYLFIICLLLIAILSLTHKVLDIYLKKPLAQLSSMIDQLRTGTYPEHYPTLNTRELQHIAINFKEMAKEVASREAELTKINKRLQENIEERKRIEYQLRESQEQFSLIAASTMDGFVECRVNQDHLLYTSRWKELLGYTDEELTNSLSVWLKRVHPNDRSSIAALSTEEVYDSEGRTEREYRIKHKNGEYRWFLGRAQILRDQEGKPYRFIGTHSDITPKKHAEQRLISTKEMLQNIINCMPSLIVGVTEQMTIALWNDTVEEDTGIMANNAEGRRFRELLPELSFIERHIQKSLTATTPVSVPKVTSIRNGVPVTYDIVIFPVTISNKQVAVLRIDDITERLRMEERIIQTEKMASISGLAAGMAHEINNPLGGILQGVQNIQRRLSPDLAPNVLKADELDISLEKMNAYMEQREIFGLLDGVTECGKRAASIVANMLEFSRSSDTKRTPCCVHNVIEKSIELAANDYQLKTQQKFDQIEIIREYDDTVSQISCAQQEIEQVLLNLLKNAAQAFATAKPTIEKPTIVITTQQSASGVMITVADNGPGMNDDIRKRVFEPFYTTKPIGDGTGLGLSVSYFIITNNHSGTISVTAAENQGSKFTIHLPHAM
ncbi:PAS domain-containing sensor histidine kinase [Halodesulfovibrio marinisediminis]|uniref:histidine kinase n=1 Tax=Halodesulfovibrio marinisediminis DSM 17456 TaxID=1121457 RepID=A0A1N6J1Q1_9BACT|nr:PAS domain-containing sensor histidine kinase [Halodesulfovibrio marinisediminis]SIO38036.1 PAS domain S-box-containing protein [Halodesulfovibrio marinisediminis DSM 17456]